MEKSFKQVNASTSSETSENINNNLDRQEVDLSIVYYTRNEEDIVEEFLDEIVKEVEKLDLTYEVLAINVPSVDNTYEALVRAGRKHANIYPINMMNVVADRLQKGYQLMLGCRLAVGERVIITDSDGQPDPKDYDKLLKKMDEGYDFVVGWRKDRAGAHSFFYNFTSLLQNILFRLLSGVKLHDKNSGLKVFTKAAAKSIVLYGRNFRDLVAQLQLKGFKGAEVPINWRERTGGIQNFKFMDRLLGGTFDLVADLFIAKMVDKPFRVWGMITFLFGVFSALFFIMSAVASLESIGMCNLAFVSLGFSLCTGLSAFISFCTGIIMEFLVSQRQFDLADYLILDDKKNVVTSRLK